MFIEYTNYALNKVAIQSTDLPPGSYGAALAVDGDLTTYSSTYVNDNNQWWRVDIGKVILLREVDVYVATDCIDCGK